MNGMISDPVVIDGPTQKTEVYLTQGIAPHFVQRAKAGGEERRFGYYSDPGYATFAHLLAA